MTRSEFIVAMTRDIVVAHIRIGASAKTGQIVNIAVELADALEARVPGVFDHPGADVARILKVMREDVDRASREVRGGSDSWGI